MRFLLCGLAGKTGTTSPGGRGVGGGGAVLCVRLEEPEAEERGLLGLDSLGFLAVTWGSDYEYQSAVRQWRFLCVWTETPLSLKCLGTPPFPDPVWHRSAAELSS